MQPVICTVSSWFKYKKTTSFKDHNAEMYAWISSVGFGALMLF